MSFTVPTTLGIYPVWIKNQHYFITPQKHLLAKKSVFLSISNIKQPTKKKLRKSLTYLIACNCNKNSIEIKIIADAEALISINRLDINCQISLVSCLAVGRVTSCHVQEKHQAQLLHNLGHQTQKTLLVLQNYYPSSSFERCPSSENSPFPSTEPEWEENKVFPLCCWELSGAFHGPVTAQRGVWAAFLLRAQRIQDLVLGNLCASWVVKESLG